MKNSILRFKKVAFAIVLAFGLLLPMTVFAQQTDGFFRGGYDSTNRDPDPDTNGNISNYGIGESVPLGSGLLIITALGAGYAISKRRRNKGFKAIKGLSAIMITMVLLLGITSCKKKTETISTPAAVEGVHITLDVCGNDGSKVVVTPGYTNPETGETYASVAYEDGDIIYVGYKNVYVGELTFNGTTNRFEGNISAVYVEGDDQPLHFYLLGGKGFKPTFVGNTATVVISDQSTQYPVISYYHSTENYTGAGTYTSKLRNKCSIMKFNVETPSTSPICIMGMNNKVTVNFATPNGTDNGFSYSKDGVGEIKMHGNVKVGADGSEENPYEMWAIVLPQSTSSAIANGAYTSTLTKGDYYTGTRPAISAIGSNQYISTGVNLTVNETPKFSVSSTQKVLFAPGNLKATTTDNWSTWTWSFMEHQYSTVEENEVELGFNYSEANIVSSFVWSATGTTIGGFFNPNSTSYTQQLPISQRHNLRIEYGEEWGKCANDANNGNGLYDYNNWRTPSIDEWTYVAQTRTVTTENKRPYGYAIVEGVKGIILLPDNWNGAIDPSFVYGSVNGMTNRYSSLTSPSWAAMEAAGVVFLPAAGWRSATTEIEDVGNYGTYWSIDYGDENYLGNKLRTFAWCFSFNYYGGDNEELPEDDDIVLENDWVCYSSCVRLIRNVE